MQSSREAGQVRQSYKERMAEQKAKHPNWSSICANHGHKECRGYRGYGCRNVCECYCHLHICPRCKQPSTAATVGRLKNASLKIQQIAKELTFGVSQ